MSGTLYVVATPIGNLDDLTLRARQTLADVDIIAAEDTRHTGRLLMHIGVKKPLFALHDYNESEAAAALVKRLEEGASVALVSDAGTPLVSDPGYRLVSRAHEHGIRVSPVPGPSAVTAALSAAGLPTDRFCFEGFLPSRRKARCDVLRALIKETRTMVFYESVHRVAESLADMAAILGDGRAAFLGRELTKLHEQCISGSISELAEAAGDGRIPGKGEFVIIVAGSDEESDAAIDAGLLLDELAAVLPPKQAAAITAKVTGGKRNELYQALLDKKS
ncbi:MAG: 16S rRNA (cytidine(1402)-2'-O)-methyltransferase [Woeseiaceae bacterium]|nr:16S rRNA (cytidine(1402)-2'-O)-methyltransferase [Woeseiaceae bacterium]